MVGVGLVAVGEAVEDGFEKEIVGGEVRQDFLVVGEVDEDVEGIFGDLLEGC